MNNPEILGSKVSGEKRIEMLERNWLSHNALWQMSAALIFGWDAGNQLNQKVTRDMGKIMMHRLMNSLGNSRVKNIKELRDILVAIISLNWSDAMNKNRMETKSENLIYFEMNNCVTYDNISKVNATDKYECECFALRSGFCDALKLEVSQECKKYLMKGNEKCEIVLSVKNWQK